MTITHVDTFAVSQMLSSFGGIYSLIKAATAFILSFFLYRALKKHLESINSDAGEILSYETMLKVVGNRKSDAVYKL